MKIIRLAVIFIFCIASFSHALETVTHEAINEHIARNSLNGFSFDLYLKKQLGITKGIEENVNSYAIWRWLRDGGKYEDKPPWTIPYVRSANHFHNPLTKKGFSGGWGPYTLTGESALFWAQMPSGTQWPGGQYSWHDVRQYYFWALTSTNLNSRDTYFAETFRGLGQLMHLVQDMSVPAHTRNDGHPLFDYYEKWAKEKIIAETIPNYQPVYFDNTSIGQPNPLASVPIANLFDTNQYTGSNPADTLKSNIGLSEYANANFVSDDTIFKDFPYPKYSPQNYKVHYKYHSSNKKRIYLRKEGDGEIIEHFATAGPFYNYLNFDPVLQKDTLKIDSVVSSDYAEKLIPRAVGYSAGLLNYFFRGEMSVSALPVFYSNNAGEREA